MQETALIKIVANFKDDSFYPLIRRKYFTMIDWFSFVGGILGLFFGFSFLSAFEIAFHVWMGVFGERTKSTWNDEKIFLREPKTVGSLMKIWKYVQKFLENSSIHSFSYVSRSDSKMSERFVL